MRADAQHGDLSGSVACDETRRNPGTYRSDVSLQQVGAITDGDRAVGFNGATHVTIPSSASLALGAGTTVEGWIKPSASASQTVARKDGQYLLRIEGGKIIARVWLGSGSYTELRTSAVLQTAAFQHVAMTYDRSRLRVYRNGSQVASKAASGTPHGSAMSLLLGSSDGYDGFKGTLDEIAVYGAALSGQTIASHWNAGRTAAAPAPTSTTSPRRPAWLRLRHLQFRAAHLAQRLLARVRRHDPLQTIPANASVRSNSGALIGKLLSNGSGPGNLAAGQPATAEVDALAVPAWRKTILHAIRTYGMYFGDTRGPSSFGVMVESGAPYTGFGAPDRMVEFAGPMAGPTMTGTTGASSGTACRGTGCVSWTGAIRPTGRHAGSGARRALPTRCGGTSVRSRA